MGSGCVFVVDADDGFYWWVDVLGVWFDVVVVLGCGGYGVYVVVV